MFARNDTGWTLYGLRRHPPPLWIDESPIMLCQRVRFQRKGVKRLIVLVPVNRRIKSAMTVMMAGTTRTVFLALWILP